MKLVINVRSGEQFDQYIGRPTRQFPNGSKSCIRAIHHTEGYNLTVWQNRIWVEGPPHVAFPRAATLAYIVFKQSEHP